MRIATRLYQLEKKVAVAIDRGRAVICPDCQTIDAATGGRIIGCCWLYPLNDGSGRTGVGCKCCTNAFTARVEIIAGQRIALEVVPCSLAEVSPV